MRNKSDEIAVANGCRFDVARGAYTVWWIEKYFPLYEGEWAGEPMLLRSGCPDVDKFIFDEWDDGGEQQSIVRAEKYSEWLRDGGEPDWQYECTMRLFGWVKFSKRWDREVRRFKAASVWIPKKQKKSPTLAGWGTYLTCGDGEMGAKCFGCAKDGKQALISMKHAIEAVGRSPALSAECKINRNEKSIEHLPTSSIYIPLSSANERTKTSKEGINGHILIDETHVVDRDFIKIISRAGISRAEPLHIEVSTAGNKPDGYGKERQDYARQVLAGAEPNDELFVAIYEAPQSLTDEELAKDPIKYGKMANPAWGHTANEEEYLADYSRSKRTISDLADFKMYRLNIWQHTSNQWLKLDDWMRCGRKLTMDRRFAAAGMDLSKTRDMSALAVAVPVGDITQLWIRLWMTEAYAEHNADRAPFMQWAQSGALTLIPGETIQEAFIRAEFEKLMGQLDIKVLVKDQTFATDFSEWAETKWPRLLQIDYPQSAQMMEKPIDDFEAAVIEQKLQHENNPCLNWQAGHASVHTNPRGFRIIKKQKRDDVRKVDGMVASVMAYWGCKQLPKRDSVYRRRGVLTA